MVHGMPYAVIRLATLHANTSCGQYSSTEDDRNEAEWISEGVQVGPIGSGTGIVGMWTGVKHLIDDPIGGQPFHVIFKSLFTNLIYRCLVAVACCVNACMSLPSQ